MMYNTEKIYVYNTAATQRNIKKTSTSRSSDLPFISTTMYYQAKK